MKIRAVGTELTHLGAKTHGQTWPS